MKRIYFTLLTLLCTIGAWAQSPRAFQVSDENGTHYYAICNVRSHGFATWNGDNAQMTHQPQISDASLWYITGIPGNYKLHNKAANKCYDSYNSFTDEGKNLFIVPNTCCTDFWCISESENLSDSKCWDAGRGGNIGHWSPTATDYTGTTWAFISIDDVVVNVSSQQADFITPATDQNDNAHWYILNQRRSTNSVINADSPIQQGANNYITRTGESFSPKNLRFDDAKKYLVRFFLDESEGSYTVQFATKAWIKESGKGKGMLLQTTTDANSATKFKFYKINDTDTHLGWKSFDGDWNVDNNGSDGPVLYWETNTVTTLDGNDDWHIYPVSITMPTLPATVADIQHWYAMDIHNIHTPIYTAEGDQRILQQSTAYADENKDGAAISDHYLWALVGNATDGVRLYNKATQKFAYQSSDADADITMDDQGTTFQIYATNSGIANTFALKAADRNYYINQRKDHLQGWTDSDYGSSIRPYEANVAGASLTRTLSDRYSTICLPFYAPLPEGLAVYSIDNIKNDDTQSLVVLTEVTDMLKAGKPYIVKASAADDYTFTNTTQLTATGERPDNGLVGVLKSTAVQPGNFLLQDNVFKQVGTTPITLAANRAYLAQLSAPAGVKALSIGMNEDETAIKVVEAITSGEARIYDLGGRRLQQLQKGINIVNGVKVLVK